MNFTNHQLEQEYFERICGPCDTLGKISPTILDLKSLIQTELLRVFSDKHPIHPNSLKHVTLESFKNLLIEQLQVNNLNLESIFEPEVIEVFLNQILNQTNLENLLAPNYLFVIIPISFDQKLLPLTQQGIKDGESFRVLLLENLESPVSYTIYRGTYLHKILPSEFLDCAFKVPDFEVNQSLSQEFKDNLKQNILQSIQKIQKLLQS